jgi:tetratricopeptide (TPR) repeat protein
MASMFGLFGHKPERNVEGELIPELRRHAVHIQDSTGTSYLAIAAPMLTFGISLLAKGKGPAGLANVINILSALIEEQQKALSLGLTIMDVKIPEQPPDQYNSVIDKLGDFATHFINKGYSFEEVGGAMADVSSKIAKLIDKDGLLGIGLLRNELAARRNEFRREQFRQTASGERCTDEAINTLLHAEASGFTLSIEKDRTFVLSRGSAGVHYLRSNIEIEKFGRAMRRREELEQTNRSPVERLTEQGQKYLEEQNLEKAISAFSAALRIKPDSGDVYFHRGVAWSNSYYNNGKKPEDLQKAIDDYTRSIEIDPEFVDGYFQRAGLLSERGKIADAIADYSKAIEKDHKASSSYFCRALLWQSAGEPGKAIADFDGAIRTGGKNDQFMALMARGKAHHELGNLELALADFNAAAAYYPKCPPGLYQQRAAILLKLGRTREAVADLGEGIATASPLADPRFIANMYEQRGQCRTQLGEAHLARQDFERAAQLKRPNP